MPYTIAEVDANAAAHMDRVPILPGYYLVRKDAHTEHLETNLNMCLR